MNTVFVLYGWKLNRKGNVKGRGSILGIYTSRLQAVARLFQADAEIDNMTFMILTRNLDSDPIYDG